MSANPGSARVLRDCGEDYALTPRPGIEDLAKTESDDDIAERYELRVTAAISLECNGIAVELIPVNFDDHLCANHSEVDPPHGSDKDLATEFHADPRETTVDNRLATGSGTRFHGRNHEPLCGSGIRKYTSKGGQRIMT